MKLIINSDTSLERVLDDIKYEYFIHRYLEVEVKNGKVRSLLQNASTHCWYQQLAADLPENDASGWKCFCKLHFGVPIMRAEDDEFRELYDSVIRKKFSYEDKIKIMKYFPVTSIMRKKQLSRYCEEMQGHFLSVRGVRLEFLNSKS